MKKAAIDFANDSVETLQAYLVKLKKEEAKLEIALTLREFPTVENELVRLITCVVELGIIERSMRMEATQTSTAEIQSKKDQVEGQIAAINHRLVKLPPPGNAAGDKLRVFYESQITQLRGSLHSAGMTKKNLKFLEHYETTLRTLKGMYDEFNKYKFPPAFDVFFHVNDLKKYLEIADDLIVQKGA